MYCGRLNSVFFFNDPATTDIYTLSLHDALPIYITLLASVKVLLFAITRQEDLIVGTPFAGRTELELADQIGFYVRTLLIRNRVAADDNFAQLLDTVKQSTLEIGRAHV